jgi:hypothetical protein
MPPEASTSWQIAAAIVVIVVVFVIAAYFELRERKKTK